MSNPDYATATPSDNISKHTTPDKDCAVVSAVFTMKWSQRESWEGQTSFIFEARESKKADRQWMDVWLPEI